MTYDCHVHVPSSRGTWGLPHFGPESYLSHMDGLEVDVSVMLPFDGLYHDPPTCNDEVAQWCAYAPDRLIAFGTAAPRNAASPAEITRCVEQLGMQGFKFHPWMQAFHPLDADMQPVYERCLEHGVPVMFHDGTPPLSTPLQVAQVAARYPKLRVILGHGGMNDLYGEAIEAARTYDNLWICMSSLHALAIRRIVAEAPLDRVVFGSDAGLAAAERHTYVDYRWSVLRDIGLSPTVYRRIVEENPARLLGVPVGAGE